MYRILGKIIAPHAKNTVRLIGTIEYMSHNFSHFSLNHTSPIFGPFDPLCYLCRFK